MLIQLCKFVILHVRKTLVSAVPMTASVRTAAKAAVEVTAKMLRARRRHVTRLVRNNLDGDPYCGASLSGAPFLCHIHGDVMRIVIECRVLIEKSNEFVCVL